MYKLKFIYEYLVLFEIWIVLIEGIKNCSDIFEAQLQQIITHEAITDL